jgi:hypothetical protein
VTTLCDVASHGLDFNQPASAVEDSDIAPLLDVLAAVEEDRAQLDHCGWVIGRQRCEEFVMSSAVLRHHRLVVVPTRREQHLARLSQVSAVRLIDEGEPALRCVADDELGLGLDQRAISRLALPQRLLG